MQVRDSELFDDGVKPTGFHQENWYINLLVLWYVFVEEVVGAGEPTHFVGGNTEGLEACSGREAVVKQSIDWQISKKAVDKEYD